MAEEKRYENKIKKWLSDHDCYYFKFFANAYTKRGVPDIIACVNGTFVGIEVKASNGKLSEIQKKNIQDIHDANGVAFVSYPEDWDDTKKLLQSLLDGNCWSAWILEYILNKKRGIYD